jgi:hypothetical protein
VADSMFNKVTDRLFYWPAGLESVKHHGHS